MKNLAVVIPLYNEEKNLPLLVEELDKTTSRLKKYQWKYYLVNDGSRDNSAAVAKELAKKNKKITFIDLARNFGKEIALTAGLDAVSADAVIFMDADLQHPPSLIPELVTKWEKGAYVVSTLRKSTEKKPLFKKVGSYLYYKIINSFSDIKFVPNTSDFKLLDRQVKLELKKFTERNRMFRGLIDWMGFDTVYVEYEAPARNSGEAGYSLFKLINLAVQSFTSYSLFPLKITGYLGAIITFFSIQLLGVMLVFKFFYKSTMFSSIAYVIVGNTILIGILLMGLGLIALYIGQIHSEVMNRPLYVVKEKVESK